MILKHKGMIPKTNVDIDLAILCLVCFKSHFKMQITTFPTTSQGYIEYYMR